MSFLDFFKDANNGESEISTSITKTNKGEDLSYLDCRKIYKEWALGRKIARALPNFALSAERKIIFDNMPSELSQLFIETARTLELNKTIKELIVTIRVFGMGGLYISHSEVDSNTSLTYNDMNKGHISFNIIDPLNLNGTIIETDPLSPMYQKVKQVVIQGKEVNLSRCYIGFNDHSFYLDYIPSNFNFGSISIYQNMVGLITIWNTCITALERLATKAGGILVKHRDSGVLNSITLRATEKMLSVINDMRNDGIASINQADSIELFNLTGISEIDAIIERLNNCILMALNDTPGAILLDNKLSNGLGDGTEDMKAILMAVEDFRETHLRPLYNFVDRFILYITFNDNVLQQIKSKYKSDFSGLTISELRENIINSFRFEWGNLYPESEATLTENQSRKLDNLLKLRELGANTQDLENLINSDDKLYTDEITLDIENLDLLNDDSYGDNLITPTKAPKATDNNV